jgi:hypothetical protein
MTDVIIVHSLMVIAFLVVVIVTHPRGGRDD